MQWRGVIPAITTPFREDLSVDHERLARHAQWLVENGCSGIVALGSLGEGGTLSGEERRDVLRTCVAALAGRANVISGVAALATREAIEQAQAAQAAGCDGLMVLPPYVYCGDWPEMRAHVGAVMAATALPCMLYNNPIAYKVDFLPEQVVELLARHANLEAVKESSADVRRILALRVLVNAFPKDSVDLFNAARGGDMARAFEIYRWFLPLLRMDTVPKFVQFIKQVQEEAGMGSRRVRPPRLGLAAADVEAVRAEFQRALALRAQAGGGV